MPADCEGDIMNGTDVLVTVETAVPGTYSTIGSQKDVTITENTAAIDASTKDSRGMVAVPGRYSATIECSALYVVDDAAYLLLQAAMRNGTNIKIELSESGSPTENIDAVCTALSRTGPDQDECIVSASFQCSGDWAAAS